MGYVHHSVYPVWFEMGRAELLRQTRTTYAEMEQRGVFVVVARLSISYLKPARYDDELVLHVELANTSPAKIEHAYQLRRDGLLLAEAQTTVACVDRAGKVMRVPREFSASNRSARD